MTRTIRISVSGREFELPCDVLENTTLSKMCEASGHNRLCTTPDENGVYHVERDPRLFEKVVIPYLYTGRLTKEALDHANPFDVMRELDYFGLMEESPPRQGGISVGQAEVWCRMVVDRLISTMGPSPMINLFFFQEEVRFHPLETSFDVSLFVGNFGDVLNQCVDLARES